jgi:uncharacterized iron-regulated membrane protein
VWRKAVYNLHLCIGLILGLYCAVLGVTGSALVFKEELNRAFHSSLYTVEVPPHPVMLSLDEMIRTFEKSYPGSTFFSITLPTTPHEAPYIGYLPAEAGHSQTSQVWHELFINPYTGKILGDQPMGGSFFNVLHDFHANFLLGKTGEAINRYGVLFLLALLLSGLWLWWPSWRMSFQRFKDDLHPRVGFYASGILLVIVLTAASYFWPAPTTATVSLLTAPFHSKESVPTQAPVKEPDGKKVKSRSKTRPLSYDMLVAQAHQALPQLSAVEIGQWKGTLRVLMGQPGDHLIWERLAFVNFDSNDGSIKSVEEPSRRPLEIRTRNWLMYIHYGQWGSGAVYDIVKFLWFLAGLCPLILFITGLMMYFSKQKKPLF